MNEPTTVPAAVVPDAAAVAELFMELLGQTHLSPPGELAAVVAERVQVAGGRDAVIYLVDHEQRTLVPVPAEPAPGISTLGWPGEGTPDADREGRGADETPFAAARAAEPVAVQGTLPGRCYATAEIVDRPAGVPGCRRLWLPLLDGTERMGVFALTVAGGPDGVHPEAVRVWERVTHLVAQLVVGKSAYGDTFEAVRRSRPMSLAAELQSALLPPITFASRGLVLGAMREPSYEGGGDAFDYAVNGGVAHLAIFDAMGHGLPASGTAAYALAAYRRSRRMRQGLAETYAEVDAALAGQFGGERYATAVLAELRLSTGELTWVSAGHPEPLLLRDGRLVKTLSTAPATPLGVELGAEDVEVGSEMLEPGDRLLLYTDGLPEARQPDGSFFGIDRLADFLERAAADGYPAPETLRRLRHAVLQHQHGQLQDDATALLVEWRGGTEHALLPRTVTLREPRDA